MTAAGPQPGQPVVFRNATVLTMDDAHTVLNNADVLVVRRADRRGRPGPRGARRHRGDRRRRRHRDAGHGRHAPAHVADGHARVRRRLDPHPVLRLLLPDLGQDLPPRGRVRGQPALGHRGDRRRRDHQRGLVARPADDRPRRGGRRRARGGTGPVRPRLRQHLPGRVGVGDHAGVPRLLHPPVRRQGRHARLPDRLRPARHRGLPGEGRLRRRARPRRRGHHARRRLERDRRRRHQPDVRRRLHDPGHDLRARGHRCPRTATTRSPRPAATPRSRRSASATPARATRRPGSCASTASRSRCPTTPASGGAATSSPRCAPRSTPTARWSTSRRTSKDAAVTNHILRAEDVVDYATRGGAKALGLDSVDRQRRGRARRPTWC